MTDFQSTSEVENGVAMTAGLGVATQKRSNIRWRMWLAVCGVALGAVLFLGWFGYQYGQRQKATLGLFREAVERSLAPGEMVVVDDSLLGWALRRGRDGVLRQSVWTMSEDAPVASLLAQMEQAKRREVVVVATPDDRLIQHLDAAGFTVAQEVGWVPWDLKRNGRALLWRGRMRIYFAVAPRVVEKPKTSGGAVSSSGAK